jgi:hypothetical protein
MYLTTLTDHPKFGGSELSMSSNVDRVAAVKVFESMKINKEDQKSWIFSL